VKVSVPNDGAILESFKRLAKIKMTTSVHAENDAIISFYMQQMERSGATDIISYSRARSSIAEAEAIQRAALLSRYAGNRIHIVHLSSRDALREVVRWKRARVSLTGETCPHYLLLRKKHLLELGSVAKINPPIRSGEDDRLELWKGVRNGSIDTIGSDHSPHTPEEKMKENVWEAAAGFAGVETMVPLMLTQVRKGRLTIERFSKLLCENPARMLGIYPKKGAIRIGSDADFILVDFARRSVIKSDHLKSKTKVTPFDNWEVTGVPIMSFLRGSRIMEEGEAVCGPTGRLVSHRAD
jgi:dihydroorotase